MLDPSASPLRPPNPFLRLIIPALLAALVTPLLPRHLPAELRLLTGWIVFAAGYLAMTWRLILQVSGDWIRSLARMEDNGRRLSNMLASLASLVSLGGVMSALSKATELSKNGQHALELWLTGAAILSVALSWLLIQTVFTLRYAHLYYDGKEGGIVFPGLNDQEDPQQKGEPDYLDFAYVAFTIGMTYQVSDTDINQKPMRLLLLGHSLLSYIYGVVIIALSISVVGSLLS